MGHTKDIVDLQGMTQVSRKCFDTTSLALPEGDQSSWGFLTRASEALDTFTLNVEAGPLGSQHSPLTPSVFIAGILVAGIGHRAWNHIRYEVRVFSRIPVNKESEPPGVEAPGRWHGVYMSRTSPTPSESATTVKSLIKSFDLGRPGGVGQNISVHKAPRSPLSGIPVRTAPAAAVSPMQRHSTYNSVWPASKGVTQRLDLPDLPLSDLLKGRGEDLKQDPYLRKSPSLESLSRPPSLGFGNTRLLSASTGGLKPQSKLSVERRDPLAALAREYGGSKRNALLKWCQKKTEGYAGRPQWW
ncbi:cytospin-B-like [Neovison vison]|uniref:cytospin-B-like n=1 Tax=Neovison vison TaxID=452646 RepID=UPI001CF009EF|nr:cytospin-B-like [Neogale vison]